MRNTISNLLTPKGRWLPTLLLLFTLGIGQMWAGTESISWGITTNAFTLSPTITPATGAHLSNASTSISLTGLSNTSSSKSGYSKPFYGSTEAFNDSKYASISFVVADGYTFTPSSLDMTVFSYGTGNLKYRVIISDSKSHSITSEDIKPASGGEAAISFSSLNTKLEGTVTIKLFLFNYNNTSSGKRTYIKSPIAISGSVEEAGGGGSDPVAVTGISLAPSSATIKVGKTVTLVPTITPNDATDKAVTWAVTSGSTYASVTDEGVVTGLAAGTAVVTATAHDGSGVKQTATITVEECPTSGTVFSMNITADEGTAYTGNNTFPALIGATYVGGAAYSGSKSGTNRTSTIDANGEYPFSANSELAIKVVMDCDLAEGDIIDITTSSTRQIKIQKVVGTELYKTANKTFTIPSGSSLIGENVFYLMRDNSESTLGSLTVTRPVYRTITLKYNDGITPDGSIEVVDGTAATKPADPTRGKYTFLGWFVGDTDTEYNWTAEVDDNITLKAHWQDPWTITFNSDGGSEVADITVKHNTKAEKPADPTKASHDFNGWYIGDTDNAFDWDANVTADYSLKAHWLELVAKYDIEYYDGETKIGTEEQVRVDQHPTAAGISTDKPLYSFVGWYTSSTLEGDPVALNAVTPSEGLKLYGKWSKVYATTYDMEAYAVSDGASKAGLETALTAAGYAYTNINDIDKGHTHNYTYDGMKYKTNDGDLSFNVVAGKVVEVKTGHLPSNDAVTMYINGVADATVFEGADEAQETHKINYFYSAAEALYRLDVEASKGTCSVKKITIRDPYTVSYNPHGADAIDAQPATPSVTLPTPANGTGVFKGWYDAETAGNKIGNAGAEYMPTANITLHAQWETLSSDNTLASWKIDGVAKDVPVSRILYIEEPYGVTPVISEAVATANVGLETPIATVAVSNTPVHYQDATEDFWYVQAEVTPQDPTAAHGYYQVRYTNAPKLGATIFKAELTAANDADYSGMYADADNSEIALVVDPDNNNEYKFSGKSNYIKMALADATFAEGDVLKMTYTTNPQQGELAIYDGTTKLQGTPYSNNTLTFSDAVGTNKSTLYIRRTDDNKFNGWVAAVEVQRYMAPIIKSYKIGAVSGTIDQDLKTIAIELPYGTTLSGVAATIEAYANGGATVTAPTILAYDTPLGYKVSSAYAEDGDVDYTVTITEAEHYEAMIVGGANYTTLAAAVAAAQADDVVKLLDNVDLMATGLEIGVNMTLDLNGFNIKAGEQLTNNINVPAGVKLTLVDNSANAEGKIYTEEAYIGAVTGYGLIRVAGELLMQSGNIYAVIDSDPANLGQFAVVVAPAGKVTVAGGQIKAGWYAISNSGNNTGSTIIVSGGELISTADFAIYNPAKESTVTVSGGVVYGAAGGIAMNRGELTVTGGTITSKDQGTTGTWGDGTGGLSNAAISASGKYESVEVEISGGTVVAEGNAIMITNGTTNPVEVAISGGQFSHVVPAEYCADGFAPVAEPNAQGKYEVEDKRIYIFDGSTMSNMATSPSGAIAWEVVGSTMGAGDKDKTYEGVHYTRALSCGNSSTTKYFRIDVAENNNAKIEVIGMSNSDSNTRSAWLTNSTNKGDIADAIASLTSTGYNPETFITDWLEEGSYYLHADNTVAIFLIRVTPKAVDPKCEVPTITTQPATDLTFGAGNMTATVVAEVSDGGTLTYQWYNADGDVAVAGQTTATLTTAVEGTYYVIVTNTLDNHRDNSIKSAEAQLAHRVMNDATLSALSYGGTAITLEDGVYNYNVELAKGTTDVPALAATATMAGYANVTIDNATEFVSYAASSTVTVKSEDLTVTKVYTVNFAVKHDLPQVDVTASTVWNWANAATTMQTIKPAAKNVEQLMANIDDEGKQLKNDAEFNSQALIFSGQEALTGNSTRWYAKGGHIKFNVTVPGKVTVEFSDNGTNNRRLKINNYLSTESSASETDVKTFAAYVEAGEVTLMGVKNDGTGVDQYIRISKIEFTAAKESRANLQLGGIGTVCLPFDVATTDRFGGTFYKADYQGPGFAYFLEETDTLQAGMPYVYVADTTFIVLLQDANANTVNDPIPDRGMYGTFTGITTEGSLTDKYVIAQKKLRRCGKDATLAPYRAYIVLNEMPTTPLEENDQANAPVRRRLGIGGNNGSTTDLQNYFEFNAEGTQKVIMNGQLYILRDGKMYNAQGQLMK